jgi:hypothetical protein
MRAHAASRGLPGRERELRMALQALHHWRLVLAMAVGAEEGARVGPGRRGMGVHRQLPGQCGHGREIPVTVHAFAGVHRLAGGRLLLVAVEAGDPGLGMLGGQGMEIRGPGGRCRKERYTAGGQNVRNFHGNSK